MAEDRRTALVTGAGRKIGKGIALHLAASGHDLVLNGSRDRAALEAVAAAAQAHGAETQIAIADIGDKGAVTGMAQAAIDRFGAVDVLINNAAIRPHADFLETTEADLQQVMDTNFLSAWRLAQACLPGMIAKGWGRIVHFTGMNAQMGTHGPTVSVSKHVLWGMTKGLSREFGRSGVTCNIISPGTFPGEDDDLSSPRYQTLLNANPAGRLGNLDDIAALIDLLVSDQGGFINGQMLQVNGGVVNQF